MMDVVLVEDPEPVVRVTFTEVVELVTNNVVDDDDEEVDPVDEELDEEEEEDELEVAEAQGLLGPVEEGQ
jgi:Ran GTPase-activating protein (RanGAP) involved in mRNA processing and transport